MRTFFTVKIRGHWCVLALGTVLWTAGASAQKMAGVAQSPDQASGANTSAHEKDDPRARAEYLEKRRSGGQPVPRGARLRAMREQEQMMRNEGKRFWQRTSTTREAESTATTPQIPSTGATPETTSAAPEQTSAPPPLSSSQWVFIGPQPTNPTTPGAGNHLSGRVTALAVDPSDASGNTVYLGAAQGGVWKTIDGGTHWTALTDAQPSLAVGSIVLDPQNPQVIYVGTGEENFGSDSYYGVGMLKSTNGGASWNNIAGSGAFGISEPESGCTQTQPGSNCGGLSIGSLAAVNQSGTTVLLAAVQGGFSNSGGLYRSIDGGSTWNLVSGIAMEGSARYTADSVVFANPTTAYAGVHTNGTVLQGVYKSTDGGITFSHDVAGITVSGTGRVSVAAGVSDTTGKTVYAAFENASNSTLAGLYRTTDGTNWTKLSGVPDFCGGGEDQCFYDMLVAVSPANANLVFVGGSGFPNNNFLLHANDGGAGGASSWILDTTNIHADQHAGAFTANGGIFYIGNDGGVYKTSGIGPSSVTWTELNSTLGITQFYGYFAIDPNNSQLAYGGTQDNGTQQFGDDIVWNEVTCGDGASAVIDENSGRVFANCADIDVRESDTGEAGSFNNVDTTLVNSGDKAGFIPPLVGDHSNPQRLYFGTTRVWQAQSSSSPTWTAISGQVTGSTLNKISNMDVSNDGTTMYTVSEDGRVFKGTALLTGSPIFNDVTSTGFPIGNYITAVRISPSSNSTAYVSLSGFNAGQHIYKSTGGSWANITGNLPNTPVNDLVIDPDLPGTLYAATDVGVFVSKNDGSTWATLQTMLPNVAVLGLRLHRASRTLRAATHGRGMWDLYVPACDPAAGPCIQLSQTTLNFGNVAVGTASPPQTVTVTNTGNATLNITGITLAGSDYSKTTNCSTVAANGGTCTITVTLTPRDGLTRLGRATIFSNLGTPVVLALTGVGLVVPVNDDVTGSATVTSLPFTATVITNGATSASNDPVPPATNAVEDGTIKNCVGVYAPNSLGYTPTDPLGYDPSPTYNHHSIWFTYTPQTTGTVDIDTLQSTGIDTVLTVWTLSGNTFTFVPNSCDDDTQDASSNPVKQSKLLGFGVTAGTTYRIMVSGYYSNSFGKIVFHMAQSGTVATGSPFTLSAASLNFTALLNRPSGPQTVTITNSSGSQQTVNSITVGGDYSTMHNCGVLAAGASCTATVTLTPTAVGQRNSVLTISDGASGSPQTVPLNGFAFNFVLSNARPHRSTRAGNNVVQGQRQQYSVSLDTATGGATLPVSLGCENVPSGATCTISPSQINAADGSTSLIVTLQTSAAVKGVVRAGAKRLGAGTPMGDYNLKVTARVGDAETSTSVPVTVVAPSRSARISH